MHQTGRFMTALVPKSALYRRLSRSATPKTHHAGHSLTSAIRKTLSAFRCKPRAHCLPSVAPTNIRGSHINSVRNGAAVSPFDTTVPSRERPPINSPHRFTNRGPRKGCGQPPTAQDTVSLLMSAPRIIAQEQPRKNAHMFATRTHARTHARRENQHRSDDSLACFGSARPRYPCALQK